MGRKAKIFNPTHFDCVDEHDFQQREIQLEEHVQNATSHQYPDSVQMNKSWKNLHKVNKLLEERGDE